jgi:DNA-binding PadR family transcriptional regulator
MRFNPFLAGVLSQGGGLLALYALNLISEAPRYGNEVMRELEIRTKGGWFANPGAIYPLLEVMESRGLIEGEWEEPEKRTRRIYRITPVGEEELERLKSVMRPKLEEAIRTLQTMNADLEGGSEEA